MTAPDLTSILSIYPVLSTLSRFISTLDLFNVSLTSKICQTYIQPGSDIFKVLCRESLCDGRGLAARQNFCKPFYGPCNERDKTPPRPMIHDDDQIEVNVWAQRCDEVNALPCRRCGINICEECRCLHRVALKTGRLQRVPFPDDNGEHQNFFAQCTKCDAATEREIEGQFLNDRCDCDVWDRWVCCKCALQERELGEEYQLLHCSDGPGMRPEEAEEDDDIDEEEYNEIVRDWNETQVLGAHQETWKVRRRGEAATVALTCMLTTNSYGA